MGLKTKNYKVKSLGIVLPEAYAIIKDITIRGVSGTATFAVQSNRENAEKVLNGEIAPIEEVEVDFIVDRKSNDRVVAYAEAKTQRREVQYNCILGEQEAIVVNMPFYGWEDDFEEAVE